MDLSCWPRGTLYPQKLALTSPTSGGRSVGIVRSRTQATEFIFFFIGESGKVPCTEFFLYQDLVSIFVFTAIIAIAPSLFYCCLLRASRQTRGANRSLVSIQLSSRCGCNLRPVAQDVKSAIFSWESPTAEDFSPRLYAINEPKYEKCITKKELETCIFKLPTSIREHIRTFVTPLVIHFSDITASLQYFVSVQMSQIVFLYIGYDRCNGVIYGLNKQHVGSTNSQI
jgi:hypothetical protein